MNVDRSLSIKAELSYIVPPQGNAVTYLCKPPDGEQRENYAYDVRECLISDARPKNDAMQLDCDGFLLLNHKTSAPRLDDEEDVRTIYYPEVEEIVKRVTGASRVLVYDHAIRKREGSRPKLTFGREHATLQPVGRIHCDYTPRSGPRRFKEVLGGDAARYNGRRFCQVNVWRGIRNPVVDAPLALCAAWSIAPEDLVRSELRYEKRTGEFFLARYSAKHRWFFYPELEHDEVIVLKGYDSDPRLAGVTLHSAFEMRDLSEDVPPRQSIEVRTFAVF